MPFGWPSGQRDGAIAEYSSARPAPSPGGGHTPGHVLAGLLVQALGLLAERHRYGPRLLDRAGLIGQPARSEERRVGKECRSQRAAEHEKKKSEPLLGSSR